MCTKNMAPIIYKCGHRKKQEFTVEECNDALKSGVRCVGDKLKEKDMGSSKKQEDCANCKDEGYSRT
jgi:hypothetical protein